MSSSNSVLKLIDNEEFKQLFIDELGWNLPSLSIQKLSLEGQEYALVPIAQFKGIQVWACNIVPNAKIQREIDKEISKISAERLVIFHDKKNQNWRWPMARESSGKGIVRLINHEHVVGNRTESLVQRLNLLRIAVNEEEPTLVEMLLKLRRAFDADQVTKKFYREFSNYQKHLVSEISGLENLSDKEWYSSLLLNRIMFIYFMQWKGFMDGNQNYLGEKLAKVSLLKGPNKFYGFFKDFLLPLFHKGLGAGEKISVPPEIAEIIGEIPYVNGGIFSEHELELSNSIDVPDSAFKTIFEFFDNYQWHLDSRSTGKPNEINPDVLGYVFEQFVNNKEVGAYYTKEDITDYMTSNTLVVSILKKIQEISSINILLPLAHTPERYIWSSIKFGDEYRDEIPEENDYDSMERKSPPHIGLPGETYWETYRRLQHLDDLRNAINDGIILTLSDLVSWNVDLETLLIDLIDGIDTAQDVIQIWNALSNLKIIDPTCGSGAFLFAALNQLENIYSVLLDVAEVHAKTSRNEELRQLLGEIKKHPNRRYFILKHASQKNLYGVDLMKEATEIARLRLFLKLMSTIDVIEDIEPLPDLEFNIKSGNLLIGITQASKLNDYLNTLDASSMMDDIFTKRDHLADLWENFIESQDNGHNAATKAKRLLNSGTVILRDTLDELFYKASNSKNNETLLDWKSQSSPFHWFIEFPSVFQQGGFDVVIGNPPYISKSKVKYSLKGHRTSECPDIYAMCMERACEILKNDGTFAMIVMSSLAFSSRYANLRSVLNDRFTTRLISSFAKIPAALFDGVKVRNTIFIGMNFEKRLSSSPMYRWIQEFRPHLMSQIRYSEVKSEIESVNTWPFVTSKKLTDFLSVKKGNLRSYVLSSGPDFFLEGREVMWDKSQGKMAPLFYKATAYNQISVSKIPPPVEDAEGNSAVTSKQKVLWFKSEEYRDLALTLFLSKWMFVWWASIGDDFDVSQENLLSFPADFKDISKSNRSALLKLSANIHSLMTQDVKWKKNAGLKVGNWNLSSSSDLLKEVDILWGQILGSEEMLAQVNSSFYSTVKTSVNLDDSTDDED